MGEPQEENDLFFVCSFIEYIARTTHNTKEYIVKKKSSIKRNIQHCTKSKFCAKRSRTKYIDTWFWYPL